MKKIGRHDPPLVENLFLLAHQRKVRLAIGVAKRDIGEPRPTVSFMVMPGDEKDNRVEQFTMVIEPLNPRMSQSLWHAIIDHIDRISPVKAQMKIITGL